MDVAPAIDLTADQRRTVLALLSRHLPNITVWAYGSRAKWTSHPASDLDLVAFAAPEQGPRIAELREAFDESNLPFRVDLFVWNDVPKDFRRRIEAEHVVLVQRGGQSTDGKQLFGLLPDDWEYTTLGAACDRGGGDIQTGPFGSQLHASDYVETGIPSIMPQNIGDNRINVEGIAHIGPDDASRLNRYLVREGDIVYSRRGDVKRRALVRSSEDGWLCGTGCLRVRFGENGVDSKYASYFLGHPSTREWIVRHAHGATMPNLNTSILSACPFVIPPKAEQHAIAHILGVFDDKIDLNDRMIETLERTARTMFEYLFVSQPRCSSGRSEMARLDDLVDINPSYPLRKGDVSSYLDMANAPTRAHTPRAISRRAYRSGARFRNGDTLIARITPCLENGKAVYVDFLNEGEVGWGSTEFVVMRPKGSIPGEFAYCLAREEGFRQFAIRNMTGTSGRQRVSSESLSAFSLPAPSPAACRKFGQCARPLFSKARANAVESRTLADLRDTLLPKLISGQIRIRDAEKLAEAAT